MKRFHGKSMPMPSKKKEICTRRPLSTGLAIGASSSMPPVVTLEAIRSVQVDEKEKHNVCVWGIAGGCPGMVPITHFFPLNPLAECSPTQHTACALSHARSAWPPSRSPRAAGRAGPSPIDAWPTPNSKQSGADGQHGVILGPCATSQNTSETGERRGRRERGRAERESEREGGQSKGSDRTPRW